MRIAFISYEHPLGISGGGIGTYLGQIAKIMVARGHSVEVFTGHVDTSDSFPHDGYTLHRVHALSVADFREKVVESFARVHRLRPFDIIESAEYGADAYFIKKRFPEVSLAVKLHTPSFLVTRLNGSPWKNPIGKLIFLLKCLRRGVVQKPFWVYDKKNDPEYELFQLADGLYSPSKSLRVIVGNKWGRQDEIAVVPNPFSPSDDLLTIPPVKKPESKLVICFIGKLEVRKGVDVLMKAIPAIVKHQKNVVFHFVGEPLPSPERGLNMQEYILQKLPGLAEHLVFFGKQPYYKIPSLLNDVHVCVFPSLWENFPNVCLESMAAAKVVIGTNNGGMADMISDKVNGLLVPPGSPQALSKIIIDVADGMYDMETIGRQARERILTEYNGENVGRLTEEFFLRTVRQKQMAHQTFQRLSA